MDVLEILRDMGIGAGRRIQGTATVGQVRAGATFMSAGNLVSTQTGTLAVQATGTQTITPGTADIVKAAGIYDGAITISGDADLVSANVKAGITIFGVTGSANVFDTTEATAPIAAATVLSGKVGYVNGAKITGTMTNVGAQAITPGTAAQTITAGYHNGSGSVAGDTDLVSANIKAGITIFGVTGATNVVDTTEGTAPAAAANILVSKIGFVNGAKITGTMANNAAPTATLATNGATKVVPAGYSPGGTITATITNLTAANVKSGAVVGGVTGTYDTEATTPIAAATVLSGKIGFINGAKVTGTMPNVGTQAITPGTAAQTITAGYHNGSGSVAGDADLVAANIVAGVTIFGVTGSAEQIATADKHTLVDLVNDADTQNTTRKQIFVDKLTGRGISSVLSDSWDALVAKSGIDTDCIAGNIKSGVTIDGITGNYGADMKKYASGTTTSDASYNVAITGLSFQPSVIKLVLTRNAQRVMAIYDAADIGIQTSSGYKFYNASVINDSTVSGITVDYGSALWITPNASGFTAKVEYANATVAWKAYE